MIWEQLWEEEIGTPAWDEVRQEYSYGSVDYASIVLANGDRLYRSRVWDAAGNVISESITAVKAA